MPKLPTYTVAIGGVDPVGGRRATAQDFGAPGLGDSGMVGAGHQIQAAAQLYLNDMEEKEARQALVQSTQVRADYARKLDEATLSGADTDKIKEAMLNDLAKVGENFNTRKGQEQLQLYTANSEIMFDQQAHSISVQRAWTQAKIDGTQFVANASALIQSNPAYLQVAEKNAADFVATFGKIRADQRAALAEDLKRDLNMAAAIAASRVNPADTKKRLEAGEWNLTAEQRSIALNKADSEIHAKRAEEAYIRAEDERRKRDANDAARDSHFAALINGTWSRRSVMDDARLNPATREHLILLAEARAKELAGQERKSDTATKNDLFLRIIAPEGTPDKIYTNDPIIQAVKDKKLNVTDANWLNSIQAGQRDENGRTFAGRLSARLGVIKSAIATDVVLNNTPGLMEPVMESLISKAETRASEMRKEGKSPNGMLDMTSKDYFFTPGLIKQTADEVKAQQLALQPPVPDMRVDKEAWRKAKAGDIVINPEGQRVPITQATIDALEKSSGKPQAFSALPNSAKEVVQAWMQETGGRLKPGQTQEQAITEWRKGQ